MRCILMSRQFSAINESFSYVIRSEDSRNTSEFLHIEHLKLDIFPKYFRPHQRTVVILAIAKRASGER